MYICLIILVYRTLTKFVIIPSFERNSADDPNDKSINFLYGTKNFTPFKHKRRNGDGTETLSKNKRVRLSRGSRMFRSTTYDSALT